MDGHEWEDVIKYQNDVFLPRIKELEQFMTQYHGPTHSISLMQAQTRGHNPSEKSHG